MLNGKPRVRLALLAAASQGILQIDLLCLLEQGSQESSMFHSNQYLFGTIPYPLEL